METLITISTDSLLILYEKYGTYSLYISLNMALFLAQKSKDFKIFKFLL